MTDQERLATEFEAQRAHLRRVAYRMLGSTAEAEDAVQDAWLRAARAGAGGVENVGGWLTTIVARICLNRLRDRRTRPEVHIPDPIVTRAEPADAADDPEQETLLADAVGVALLVVLETLSPSERVAFVLHDMFAIPFTAIAELLETSPAAARQLASRGRRRVRGAARAEGSMRAQRQVVDAFFAAARAGDVDALVAVLHPDVVSRTEGLMTDLRRGAAEVAGQALRFANPAATLYRVVVNGSAGVVVTVGGRPAAVIAFTVAGGRIAEIDAINDPVRAAALVGGVPLD